jgi:tetratricopeptide (TPR) repeat protein
MVDRYQQAKQEFLTLLRYTDETYMSQEFKDRYDAVIADFTAVIQADMSRPEPYVRRGLTYYMLKKYEESLRDFDAAINLAPEYALLHYYRGLVNAALEQDNQALNDYNQAIALDPTFSKPYYTRGLIYRDQQAPQKAMADFAQYLELDNDKNLARQEVLFFITLIPLGDFITQAQEQLDSLNSSADMPATEQE